MTDVPWTWFVLRSSGLVSVGLLTVAVVVGVLGPRLAPTPRLAGIAVHRGAATMGALLVVLHVALAVLDRWISLDWPAALLPGTAGWQRWGVALGALSVDLLLALLLTTATRQAAPRLWRRVHLAAYPAWALAVGHGVLVGTDAGLMRSVALAAAGLVGLAVAARFLLPRRGPSDAVRTPESPTPAAMARGGL